MKQRNASCLSVDLYFLPEEELNPVAVIHNNG